MEMSKKKYRLVIFDIDGTLLDTSEGLLNSAAYTIKELGYEMPSQKILMSFVGPRIQDSLQRVYGLCGEELDRAAAIFRNHYKMKDVLLAKPYEGIYEVLNRLKEKNVHMAVATNKRQDFAELLMQKYEFTDYIECIYGTDLKGALKKVNLICKCVQSFSDCQIDEVLMVGDSSYDAIAAQEVGVNFIGVTYGFEFRMKDDVDKWPNVGCLDKFNLLTKYVIC